MISHNEGKLKEKVKSRAMGAFSTDDMYIDKDSWVINLSNYQLSLHEKCVLQNGLNFATTPRVILITNIVTNIETGVYNLSENSKVTVCAAAVNILKNSKPETNPNIWRQQLTAVMNLKQDSSVTVVPVDKMKAVVVMDTVEYREKVSALFSDANTYIKITDKYRNPTSRVGNDLNRQTNHRSTNLVHLYVPLPAVSTHQPTMYPKILFPCYHHC